MNFKATKGQGAVQNVHNHFEKNLYEKTIYEDDCLNENGEPEERITKTEYLEVFPKTIMNEVPRKCMPL